MEGIDFQYNDRGFEKNDFHLSQLLAPHIGNVWHVSEWPWDTKEVITQIIHHKIWWIQSTFAPAGGALLSLNEISSILSLSSDCIVQAILWMAHGSILSDTYSFIAK